MRSSFLSLLPLLGAAGTVSAFECSVDAFQNYFGDNATVLTAEHIPQNGTFNVPSSDIAYPTSPTNLRELCAIQVNVSTSPISNYMFGLFLPKDWNHRFLAVGNGRYAGGINWLDMGNGVNYGFAVVSTDTGHNSSSSGTSWAAGNNERLIDWGYRAMHGSIVLAKGVAKEYYSSDLAYSYYLGCSTGGRQGLKEVEMYPEDFDGVVAGAPAWWTTHLQLSNLKTYLYNYPANASYHIPERLFNVTGDEVLRQCDPQDGVVDNIISDSRSCVFDSSTLLCGAPGRNSTNCLTPAQITTLDKIYNDWVETNQTMVFPQYQLGSEASWAITMGDGSRSTIENSAGYVRHFLGLGDDWDPTSLSYDTVQLSDAMNPGNATANDFNIAPFQARGGKLLQYHGMADGAIATGSSVMYRENVERTLIPQGVDLDSFYRFFLVPGMMHCMQTPENMEAPWYFSGGNQASYLAAGTGVSGVPGYRDADHDVLLAMVRWVENGTAPEHIIATKYKDDDPQKGVHRQRPVCMYPKQATYDGEGDVNDPDSWACKLLY
ncbi:putative ferulic acid Esterase/Feruloyl esterase [Saccharata proteae CBS 121410]|uniref:Carboxylic ester hydrolase n=1 Tax=Saccharata proteae CBS 121410 TaxID=1314787 RepID=A0A9P4LVZ5_9PEZI|nr:putative ferulic acid Esterase/Feruloyl esterase [Saccharata proteae CBS 121410]